VWFCHGCGKGGDLFHFIQQIERIDFREALEMLADRAGVELESGPRSDRGAGRKRRRSIELNGKAQAYYQHVLWATDAGERGRALLIDRRIDEALARRFGVGFAPAGGAGEDALTRYLTARPEPASMRWWKPVWPIRPGGAGPAIAFGIALCSDPRRSWRGARIRGASPRRCQAEVPE